MALYVDTSKCAADAQIRNDGAIQYNLGLIMMVLGVPELTDKTLPEFHARLEFYQRLSEFLQPDEADAYWTAAQAAKGVRINCTAEKQTAWIKRMSTERFRDIVYSQKRRAEQAQGQTSNQLPLAV